jgi:SAM-dependent methyltransferase
MATKQDWMGRVGAEWADKSGALDGFLGPSGDAAMTALGLRPGWRVLDLGCGAGTTSFQLAEAVGPDGEVVGVDVSPDLVAKAERRRVARPETPVKFLLADAAEAPLPGPFDALYSRCGAMFFDDPIPAYIHLRAVMKPGAPLAIACWRPAPLNQWAALPLKLARDLLGETTAPAPSGAPGPFAWAEPEIFEPILSGAGWREVAWAEVDGTFAPSAGDDPDPVRRAIAFTLRIGPLASRLRDAPPEMRAAIAARLEEGFAPLVSDGAVRLKWAAWVITARA